VNEQLTTPRRRRIDHHLHAGLVVHRGRRVLPLGERPWAVPDVLLFGERT